MTCSTSLASAVSDAWIDAGSMIAAFYREMYKHASSHRAAPSFAGSRLTISSYAKPRPAGIGQTVAFSHNLYLIGNRVH
jgi:hypothetical protein